MGGLRGEILHDHVGPWLRRDFGLIVFVVVLIVSSTCGGHHCNRVFLSCRTGKGIEDVRYAAGATAAYCEAIAQKQYFVFGVSKVRECH